MTFFSTHYDVARPVGIQRNTRDDFAWQEGQTVRSNFNSHAMKGTWKRTETDQTWGGGSQRKAEGESCMFYLFLKVRFTCPK